MKNNEIFIKKSNSMKVKNNKKIKNNSKKNKKKYPS